MRTNTKPKHPPIKTHEGAIAARINAEQQLRRSVMACMLFEDTLKKGNTFYELGEEVAARIADLIPKVAPIKVAQIAIEARERMKLRHMPLFIVREMARLPKHKELVGQTLAAIIQRADELAEFVSIYWKDKRQPLSAQVKLGLAKAFIKFNEYSLAKYNRDGAVKLRDVLFLCHAKPKDEEQDALWKRLIAGELETPDTWEVSLSGGADKKTTFERLIKEGKLGGLAFIRNLRNMHEAGISKSVVNDYAGVVDISKILPFRFIAAARAVPVWEDVIESMMFRALESVEKLAGKTIIVVDNSGSMMGAKVSENSDIDRSDAACALAILLRELCEDCVVISFANDPVIIPARRGFALADAIKKSPSGGTYTDRAIKLANTHGYNRVIVVTDEQSHQTISAPQGLGYFINVSVNKNGIGYGRWVHIDGWSEAIIDYIREYERSEMDWNAPNVKSV